MFISFLFNCTLYFYVPKTSGQHSGPRKKYVWLIVVNITSGDPRFACLGDCLFITRGPLGFLFLSFLIVDMFIRVLGI